MAAMCAVTLKTPVILLVFYCILYAHQPRLFIPDASNFHSGLYDINDMNIIVKESFLSGILNANHQMKKVLGTKLSRFSYLLMLRYVRDPRTRYQTFARAKDLKLFIKMYKVYLVIIIFLNLL